MMWRKEESCGVVGAQLGLFGDLAAPATPDVKSGTRGTRGTRGARGSADTRDALIASDSPDANDSLQSRRNVQAVPVGVVTDAHMQTAMRLAKAMKRAGYARSAKAGRGTQQRAGKSGNTRAQRYAKAEAERRLGNAICDHMLASLREQVARENQTH